MEVENESIDESIVTTNTADQMNLSPISYDDIKIGKWLITIYENEKWLGNVIKKVERKMQFSLTRCSILMLYRFYPKSMQMIKMDVNGFGATNCH